MVRCVGATINEKGKLYESKGKRVFVASPGNGCPRAVASRGSVLFRDDYYGNVRLNSKLFKALKSV